VTENDRVSALLASELSYRWILLRMLEYCYQPRGYLAVQEYTLGLLNERVGIHTPDVLIKWLEDCGGLERIQIEGTGKWRTTLAGARAIDQFSRGLPLQHLLSTQPEYRQVYVEILKFCSQPRKRAEIEESLAGNITIQSSRLHPAYFIQELENHGGLEWSGQHWRTTPTAEGATE
jgi:hypothetical protein